MGEEAVRIALVFGRKRAGLTQQQLANRLGWHQSKVAKIEVGRCYLRVSDMFAYAEKVSYPITADEWSRALTAPPRRHPASFGT